MISGRENLLIPSFLISLAKQVLLVLNNEEPILLPLNKADEESYNINQHPNVYLGV
jgi:hypothetical protein